MVQPIFFLFSTTVAIAFFVGSLVLMSCGRSLGARQIAEDGSGAMAGHGAIEGAVFALMGLLLAFAINGALQRFDERRQLILQEANAVATAYDRFDLLEHEASPALKAKFKDYVQARMELYRVPIDFSLWNGFAVYSSEQQNKILALKDEIWDRTVAACPPTSNRAACLVLLQSLNSVFEAARLRNGANEKHPPQIIYVMLFGLGLGGSLLAGFGMATAKKRRWVHMVIFAGALAVTLFIVTDIEFPRLGFFRIDAFDHFLAEAYRHMR